MTNQKPDSVLFPLAGAGVGATISQTVGGIGLVGSFGGMGIGLVPMTAAGGIVGMATYGACQAIAQQDVTAIAAIGLGGLGGAMVYSSIGRMGLSIGGKAFSIGMGSMAMAGGIFGLGIYGLAKMIDLGTSKESFAETFNRMESKISHQEFYCQALLELDPQLSEWMLIQKINDLEIEDKLQTLKTQIYGGLSHINSSQITKQKKTLPKIPESAWQQLEIELELEAIKARIYA